MLEVDIATAPSVSFDLSPSAEQAMMSAGVSEDTIKAMAAREEGGAPGSAVQGYPAAPSVPRSVAPLAAVPKFEVMGGFSYLRVHASGKEAAAVVGVAGFVPEQR